MAVKIISVALLTFLATAIVCPFFINRMKQLQYGQQIRDDGPARHSIKAGTPTMGGVVMLLAAAVVSIIFAGKSPVLYLLLIITLGCGLIGFLDDYLKLFFNRSLGLKARSKLAGLVALSLIYILLSGYMGLYSTKLMLPVLNLAFDLGIVYPAFVFIIILGFSNSVNLTDGVDGLAAGTSAIALIAFLIIAIITGFPEAAIFCAALTGACLGFLIYNRHPARLFMGDVGSLALGGALAALSLVTKTELFLVIIGGIFVLEAFSVMAQVTSYQLTGRRIFLMSPLHHHFELKGWSEWQVVKVFWSVALLFAVTGVAVFSR
ncbi:MAG: phospho-N-acetylmuramoyl-pentapeptide-transferase [Dethiobacteria bacterium]|nr:phospho-N-acetylmuramoyl-pentapeptide-transferase [Dethiobacteria bacterium]